jgi:hypothetical protein
MTALRRAVAGPKNARLIRIAAGQTRQDLACSEPTAQTSGSGNPPCTFPIHCFTTVCWYPAASMDWGRYGRS